MKREPDWRNVEEVDGIIDRERLLTPREAARLLGVSPYTLHGWRGRNPRCGRGPEFIRVGGLPSGGSRHGRIRYRLAALRQFIEEGTVRPSSRIR